MEPVAENLADEGEEPLPPWVRRALLTVQEGEDAEEPLVPNLWLLTSRDEAEEDEREEPVRGLLRRALLAVDP